MRLLANKVKRKRPISTGFCGVLDEKDCFYWFLWGFWLGKLETAPLDAAILALHQSLSLRFVLRSPEPFWHAL
jgi:hypothetical protein